MGLRRAVHYLMMAVMVVVCGLFVQVDAIGGRASRHGEHVHGSDKKESAEVEDGPLSQTEKEVSEMGLEEVEQALKKTESDKQAKLQLHNEATEAWAKAHYSDAETPAMRKAELEYNKHCEILEQLTDRFEELTGKVWWKDEEVKRIKTMFKENEGFLREKTKSYTKAVDAELQSHNPHDKGAAIEKARAELKSALGGAETLKEWGVEKLPGATAKEEFTAFQKAIETAEEVLRVKSQADTKVVDVAQNSRNSHDQRAAIDKAHSATHLLEAKRGKKVEVAGVQLKQQFRYTK